MSNFEFKDDSDQELLNEIIRLGPWVDHNIRLSSNVSTIGVDKGQNRKIIPVMDILVSLLGPRFDNYSFLDLACLEGGYSIEAALLGAKVLGIEGRQKNLDKCNFALEKLGLKNLNFKLGDVRQVSVIELGKFDVILCMGILYHLDDPVSFLETISSLCKKYIVIDTHISYEDEEKHQSVDPNLRENLSELTYLIVKEKSYNGRFYQEFSPNTSKDVKEGCLQSSLDNEKSFWATQKSLLDMLKAAGFDGVWQYLTLLRGGEWSSQSFARILIVASKSEITYSSPIWK